jgi:carbon-monoxide dehydrogenase medium subunit
MTGYAAPAYMEEVVTLLTNDPSARVLAGGQSLLVQPNRSRIANALLVDLRKIPGLAEIEGHRDGTIKIGAMTTLANLASNEAIRDAYPALAEAVRTMGDAQLRNRATVGGSLAGADPDDDVPALMLALDATVQAVGPQAARAIRADALFTGPRQTSLGSSEVIVAVTIPPSTGRSGIAYEKFKHPATLFTICGVAARVAVNEQGIIADARVALCGAAQHPMRLSALEKALVNQRPSDVGTSTAGDAAVAGVTFKGDLFASPEYRRHLTRVLAERALKQAIARATAR